MNLVEINFLGWEKWNPRKDIKHPRWFAMSNRIMEDDQIQSLTDAEFRAFVYLICLASQNNSAQVSVNLEKAERVSGIKKLVFEKTIEKLIAFAICTRSERECTEPVRNPTATLQDRTLQDRTGQDTEIPPDDVEKLNPRVLEEIWNSDCGTFSKIREFTNARKAKARSELAKYPDIAHWREVLTRWKNSKFCREVWKPTFDDWLSETKRISALEGKHDDRNGPYSNKNAPPLNETAEERTQRLIAEHDAWQARKREIYGEGA